MLVLLRREVTRGLSGLVQRAFLRVRDVKDCR